MVLELPHGMDLVLFDGLPKLWRTLRPAVLVVAAEQPDKLHHLFARREMFREKISWIRSARDFPEVNLSSPYTLLHP